MQRKNETKLIVSSLYEIKYIDKKRSERYGNHQWTSMSSFFRKKYKRLSWAYTSTFIYQQYKRANSKSNDIHYIIRV